MEILDYVLRLPGLLLAISVHEYAHARIAWNLGDDTAERAGRMTLEPWAHLDWVGALMLLFFRFGWARPVPVQAYRFDNPRKGMAKVALAGPAANVIMFFLLYIVAVLTQGPLSRTSASVLTEILYEAAVLNLGLGVFNLFPIPPLDGSRIVAVFLPSSALDFWENLERYGFIIMIGLLYTGIVSAFTTPVMNFFFGVASTIAGWILPG